jgi:hypothetical protein
MGSKVSTATLKLAWAGIGMVPHAMGRGGGVGGWGGGAGL